VWLQNGAHVAAMQSACLHAAHTMNEWINRGGGGCPPSGFRFSSAAFSAALCPNIAKARGERFVLGVVKFSLLDSSTDGAE